MSHAACAGALEPAHGVRDARADGPRVREGRPEDACVEGPDLLEVHALLGKRGSALEGRGRQETLLDEPFGRDEERVAREAVEPA